MCAFYVCSCFTFKSQENLISCTVDDVEVKKKKVENVLLKKGHVHNYGKGLSLNGIFKRGMSSLLPNSLERQMDPKKLTKARDVVQKKIANSNRKEQKKTTSHNHLLSTKRMEA